MAFSGGVCGLLWVAIAQPGNPIDAGLMMATATFGGLLPDIDHPQASISRKNIIFGALSRVISGFSWGKHRRVIHTVPICILFGVIGFFLTRLLGQGVLEVLSRAPAGIEITESNLTHIAFIVGMGFLVGSIGHLIADTCNKEGIMWLWPISKKRISILPITTSSPLETVFMVATTVVTCVLLVITINNGAFGDIMPEDMLSQLNLKK